jgi:hypothetical protein
MYSGIYKMRSVHTVMLVANSILLRVKHKIKCRSAWRCKTSRCPKVASSPQSSLNPASSHSLAEHNFGRKVPSPTPPSALLSMSGLTTYCDEYDSILPSMVLQQLPCGLAGTEDKLVAVAPRNLGAMHADFSTDMCCVWYDFSSMVCSSSTIDEVIRRAYDYRVSVQMFLMAQFCCDMAPRYSGKLI